jgi:ssDNA-binding Zn-finger/Zn-ribbon topoisomerase 1
MPCIQPKYHTGLEISGLTCPKCQANSMEDGFGLEDRPTGDGCNILHLDDVLYCPQCHKRLSGQKYVSIQYNQDILELCPHCKGTGRVKKDGL